MCQLGSFLSLLFLQASFFPATQASPDLEESPAAPNRAMTKAPEAARSASAAAATNKTDQYVTKQSLPGASDHPQAANTVVGDSDGDTTEGALASEGQDKDAGAENERPPKPMQVARASAAQQAVQGESQHAGKQGTASQPNAGHTDSGIGARSAAGKTSTTAAGTADAEQPVASTGPKTDSQQKSVAAHTAAAVPVDEIVGRKGRKTGTAGKTQAAKESEVLPAQEVAVTDKADGAAPKKRSRTARKPTAKQLAASIAAEDAEAAATSNSDTKVLAHFALLPALQCLNISVHVLSDLR